MDVCGRDAFCAMLSALFCAHCICARALFNEKKRTSAM